VKSNKGVGTLLLVVVACAALVLIQLLRPELADRYQSARAKSDVLMLPSGEQVLVGSLGYRAALADFIFAHVLVSYGLHLKEKRRFEFIAHYLDVASTLDPKFRSPYYYADTLITMQAKASTRADYDAARRLLERGLKERPYDTELWLVAGQFMAYIAPQYLTDEKAREEYRLAGAKILARTCELVGHNENIPYHCITAASLLDKAGDRDAMVRFLERAVNVIDDPALQKVALAYLEKAQGESARERAAQRREALDHAWKSDLLFVSRNKALVLGPGFDPAECAGDAEGCVTSWREWGERHQARFEGPAAP
jgi:tetratricopeptide (TPR) repeat protein